MTTLLQDLRLAFRQLRRRPAFAATAVLTLAIGMGVNAVAFSVVNGLLLKGFAAKARPGVGRIATTPPGDEIGYASLQEYERFAEATHGSLDVAAEGRLSLAWRHDDVTETAWVLFVSPNYFSMLTAEAIAGQLRVQPVPGGSPSVVVGERFWRDRLASASLAGLTLRLNNIDVSVAGIVPESFTGPAGLYSPDVWLPLDDAELFSTSSALQKRDKRWLFLLGKLQDGATLAQVQGQLGTAAAVMARDWPETHKTRGVRFRMLGEKNSELRALSTAAAVAMGIIGLILLLACFNVANLLLARGVEREREMGIRAALGAAPSRLTRLVITEGCVLAAMAGALALVLTWWTQSIVSAFAIPIEEPQHVDLTADLNVVGFILAVVFVSGVLPGLWPAVAAARVNVLRALGSQGATSVSGRPSRLGRWLVGAQIAGSTAFLAVAALLIQSYAGLSTADVGLARQHLVIADFEPASHGYGADRAERYVDALLARVGALPGVVDVAVADRAPFFIGMDRETSVWPAGGRCEGDSCPKYPTYAVGPGYFRTMGISIKEGREFERGRNASEIVINQAFALKQWPNGGGVGDTVKIGTDGKLLTVIGITEKTRIRGLDRERPALFLPIGAEDFGGTLSVVARTSGTPANAVRPLVDAARAIDPNVSMLSVKTMEQRMAVQLWPFRTLSWTFSICGGLAIVLATVGLSGVVIHAVSRRMREFGVRVSIGATPRDLVVDVLKGSARLFVPGLVTGLLLAAAAGRLTQLVFVGVNVLNPLVYLGVALAQGAIVLLACIGPALRASRVDPLIALRAD
jgi:putative ABC transport system permease protein